MCIRDRNNAVETARSAFANTRAASRGFQMPGPPGAAVDACNGKSTGSACSFKISGHKLAGQCTPFPGGTACRPEIGPDGKPLVVNSNSTVSLEIDKEENKAVSKSGMLLSLLGVGVLFAGSLWATYKSCLLYTSDAADEEDSVDLGGCRIIKKKKNEEKTKRTSEEQSKNIVERG
eukprot:TRINITY_DN16406_c0_g1_i1.p1 TRINITY_DN16406_c0_g1~~TRINITY_DN16406_c0_g1_i1.p1  ORF type:complete len:176 (+),score=27.19 TRINITY_DN16406_c0_g1_i1:43-570(+)